MEAAFKVVAAQSCIKDEKIKSFEETVEGFRTGDPGAHRLWQTQVFDFTVKQD
jgi:hypothetical protein